MSPLYELLLNIKANPKQYLGTASLDRLWHFINGYRSVSIERNLPEPDLFHIDFYEYLSKQYGIPLGHLRGNVIYVFTHSDESAFYAFFDHLEQYIDHKDLRTILETPNEGGI